MLYEVNKLGRDEIKMVVDAQNSLAIGPDMLLNGGKIAPRGLLISGHSIDDLEHYLDNGGQMTGIFVDSHMDKLAGYILTAPGKMFTKKCERAQIDWYVVGNRKQLLQHILTSGNYVYLDQIGVRWEHQKRGVANALLEDFEKRNPQENVFVMVIRKPIDNIRSFNFFLEHKYCSVAGVYFDKFGTVSDFYGELLFKFLSK